MVSDLVESSLAGHPLEGLLFGGAPCPNSLVLRARKAFPIATLFVPLDRLASFISLTMIHRIQGYGLTETNSIAVSVRSMSTRERPTLKTSLLFSRPRAKTTLSGRGVQAYLLL